MEFGDINIQDLQLGHSIDVNPSSGSISASVDIDLPAGRNGFGPSLSLEYASNSNNSIFGLGWNLSGLAFISIDTTKGLPKYDGTDTFAFNGSQLVPKLIKVGNAWKEKITENPNFWIYYYREKFEDEFTRFEKWVKKTDSSIHWRVRSIENILSIYGEDPTGVSRIHDPADKNKVYIWLLESQYDEAGNNSRYIYQKEDKDGIDVTSPFEKKRINKFLSTGFSQKYPARILYGNSVPITVDTPIPLNNEWLYEIVFDYGQYINKPYTSSDPAAGSARKKRKDPFSVYHTGFEIRSYRLCSRILIYHHFDQLAPTSLTGIYEFNYNEQPVGTTLTGVIYTGVRRDLITATYSEKSMPEIVFEYSEPKVGKIFKATPKETTENFPSGFNYNKTQMIDLFSEGLPGILTETANAWYYKPNLGDGKFGRQATVIEKPPTELNNYSLSDFDLNGNIKLFTINGRFAGYYEYDRDKNKWSGFRTFENIPQLNHFSFIDVNADGYSDLVAERDDKIICYPFKGKEGFGKPHEFAKPVSNSSFAPTIGENASLDYFLSDMTGDGLPDQIRIQNGRTEYFPNLGNGRFGECVLMENSPIFDFDNSFDASRLRLYDLDGNGNTDIIYIGKGELRYWYNESGNQFSEGGKITGLPYIDNISSAIILDLLGNGTPCLAWSNSLTQFEQHPLQYLELTDGIKPRLLTSLKNNMGKEYKVEYGHSARHYLDAKQSGDPWLSTIPNHFTVADKLIVTDHISNSKMTSEYKFRDGYYDGHEKSFVTFGIVEQYDTAVYGSSGVAADLTEPCCIKTWIHNGLFGWDERRAKQYYNKDVKQPLLVHQNFEQTDALDAEDFIAGFRSLAGKVCRQEIYSVNSEGKNSEHPYHVSQNAYYIRRLQPKTTHDDPCFYNFQSEALSIEYEKSDKDPKITHHLTLGVNEYGDIEKDLSIAYARRTVVPGRSAVQAKDVITANIHFFSHIDTADQYQPGILYETKSFEINHIAHTPDECVSYQSVQTNFDALIAAAKKFDTTLNSGGISEARLISWDRTFFWNINRDDVLPAGQVAELVLAHHEESACFTTRLMTNAFGAKVNAVMLSDPNEGNYIEKDGYWWQHTGINHYKNANEFYNLDHVEKDAGSITSFLYDAYRIAIVGVTDAINNTRKGMIDYNLVEPFRITDQNDNISEVLYDPLGVVIVSSYQGTISDNANIVQPYGFGWIKDYVSRNDESFQNILSNPGSFIQEGTNYLYYDTNRWKNEGKPLRSIMLSRENLLHPGDGNRDSTVSTGIAISYQDGFGRIIQTKQKIEPGDAFERKTDGTLNTDITGDPILANTNNRWLVSGHVVYNRKQQPVQKFEPYFSSTPEFETDQVLEALGASAKYYYDALGKALRTDFPNGTFNEIKYSPWENKVYDLNDTVDRSLYKTYREILPDSDPEKKALQRSLLHKDTPVTIQLDPAGNQVMIIEQNNDGSARIIEKKFDALGNLYQIIDARGLLAFEYKRDMFGRLLYEKSIDSGEKWSFYNNAEQPIHLWNGRLIHQRTTYDKMDRVVFVRVDGALGLNQITERFVYGEDPGIANAKDKNLLGEVVKHYDQAGFSEVTKLTPEGNPVRIERRLLSQFTNEANWDNPAGVAMDGTIYFSEFTYDGMNRIITQRLADKTIRKYQFHPGGVINKITVSVNGGADMEVLKNNSLDPKGLRASALFGNDIQLKYTYDQDTFRMKRLLSKRATGDMRTYQDIRYTYDPIGNLIYLNDEAQKPAAALPVINGLTIDADSDFEYDALYQLKIARGRVHQALLQNDYIDRGRENAVPANWGKGTRHITLNNGAAVERYTRKYDYDVAGNIKSIRHEGSTQNWIQDIWTSPTSNRSITLKDLNGINVTNPETRFDESGNCIYMPHLRSVEWNYRNNISKAIVIDRTAQGKPNDEEIYIYGGDGIRVRKITQRLVDTVNDIVELCEKIYMGGYEVKRITRGGVEILRRFTSTINDGVNTIARLHRWETDNFNRETDVLNQPKIHYQLCNHINSCSLELDEDGAIITYEEYFPFGATSFIAGNNKRDIDLKDFRYSGKERDDFTGLYYFGYRYYAHWIGGWMSPDPLGPEDSENLYLYVHNNPVNLIDPNGLETKKKTGEVKYVKPAEIRKLFNAYEARLTKEQKEKNLREGKTILHYDYNTKTISSITVQEAHRIAEAEIAKGNDVGIEEPPEPPPDPPNPNDKVTVADGITTIDFAEDVILGGGKQSIVMPGEKTGKVASKGTGGKATSSGASSKRRKGAGGVHGGTGGGGDGKVAANVGGDGSNTGDGKTGDGSGGGGIGTEGSGPGLGSQGTGTGGGGDVTTKKIGTADGTGDKTGTGKGDGSKSAGKKDELNKTGPPGDDGSIDGKPEGKKGGKVGGKGKSQSNQVNGNTSDTPGGQPGGTGTSAEGSLDGTETQEGPQRDGQQEGIGQSAGQGTATEGSGGTQTTESKGNNPQQTATKQSDRAANEANKQNPQDKAGEGKGGDPRSNFMDTITRVAGYFNLERGKHAKGGEAGGVPGGMNLFHLNLPMWARRSLQVLYIATTIVTTIIPLGKAALAAKVAVQGALKVGLKATATKLLAKVAAKIPTKAAMAAGASKIGHAVAAVPLTLIKILKGPPKALLKPSAELLKRFAAHPNALRDVANEVHLMENVIGKTVAVTKATLKNGESYFFAAINSGAKGLGVAQRELLEKLGVNIVPQYFKGIPIMQKIYHAEVNMIHFLEGAPLAELRWGISMVGKKASELCPDCIRRIGYFDAKMGIKSFIENLFGT